LELCWLKDILKRFYLLKITFAHKLFFLLLNLKSTLKTRSILLRFWRWHIFDCCAIQCKGINWFIYSDNGLSMKGMCLNRWIQEQQLLKCSSFFINFNSRFWIQYDFLWPGSKTCIDLELLSKHRRHCHTFLWYCIILKCGCVHLWYTEVLKLGKYIRHIHGMTSCFEHNSTRNKNHVISVPNSSV
jgi:hypothetical protein